VTDDDHRDHDDDDDDDDDDWCLVILFYWGCLNFASGLTPDVPMNNCIILV